MTNSIFLTFAQLGPFLASTVEEHCRTNYRGKSRSTVEEFGFIFEKRPFLLPIDSNVHLLL